MLLWTWGYICLFELVFSFSLGRYLEVELLDSMVVLLLIFWGTSVLFSMTAVPIHIPTAVHKSSLISTSSLTLFLGVFENSHSNKCEVFSLWFWFALPWWLGMLSIFSCTCWRSVCCLWKKVYLDPLPIFKSDFFFFFFLAIGLYEFFIYFGY